MRHSIELTATEARDLLDTAEGFAAATKAVLSDPLDADKNTAAMAATQGLILFALKMAAGVAACEAAALCANLTAQDTIH